jgi:hypothetical protein
MYVDLTKPDRFRNSEDRIEDLLWKIESRFNDIKYSNELIIDIEITVEFEHTKEELDEICELYKKNGWRSIEYYKKDVEYDDCKEIKYTFEFKF